MVTAADLMRVAPESIYRSHPLVVRLMSCSHIYLDYLRVRYLARGDYSDLPLEEAVEKILADLDDESVGFDPERFG